MNLYVKVLFACTASIVNLEAIAVPLSCYQDPRTDAVQCVEEKAILEKDGIRSAALWNGGPKEINKSNLTVHVNCGTNVMHLKDRKGVSFAGASASETAASRRLRDIICQAQITKRKSKK